MNCSLVKIADEMKKCREICFVYHIRPDGDCIGSAYAIALAVQSVGIKCNVVGTYDVPNMQKYLTDKVKLDKLENPVYCAIDSASPQRVGEYADKHFTFCIDHHQNNSINADYKYVEPDAGACAEIIFKLIQAMDVTITKDIADFLYTGLVCDTMCFRTSDTNAQSFETAAELVKCGADVFQIGRHNMFYKSRGRLKIEEILKSSFHFVADGKIGTGIITLNDLKTADILDSELEGINSLIDEIEELCIGVTIRELPDGRSRCSMRSRGIFHADEICAIHGGGGHVHAACCELNMPPEQARKVIEDTCLAYFIAKEKAI
jgi:phosphoesterase RecJ-like protein